MYHGSTVKVEAPQILYKEIGRDFGPAFYTTDIRAQAERWAVRRAKIANRRGRGHRGIVNIYEWDATADLKMLRFDGPSTEWLELVLKCRSDSSYRHGYDVVIGSIANDNVGETVSYVLQGIMRREDALERLKFEKINNQIAFCTVASLERLAYRDCYETEV